MPSVESNYEKLRCKGCGEVFQHGGPTAGPKEPCAYCGGGEWVRVKIQDVCDFCSTNFDHGAKCWSYPCGPFAFPYQVVGSTPEMSADDWSACLECHKLIQAGDLEALSLRGVELELERDPEARPLRPMLLKMTRMLHQRFNENRTGDPYEEIVE